MAETTGSNESSGGAERRPGRHKTRRALWIVGGVVLAPPLFIVLAVTTIGRLNAIHPIQRRLPDDLERLVKAAAEVPAPRVQPTAAAPNAKAVADAQQPAWPSSEPPAMPEDYFRFQIAKGYRVEGAKLWLELEKMDKDDKSILEAWENHYPPTGLFASWTPASPLTDAQQKWLVDHGRLFNLIHRMNAAGGPPMPTWRDIDLIKPTGRLFTNFGFLLPSPVFCVCRMLAAESRRRRDAGDLDGAVACLADAVAFPCFKDPRNPMAEAESKRQASDVVAQAIEAWLTKSPLPAPVARRLLAVADSATGAAAAVQSRLPMEYADERTMLILALDQPLIVSVFAGRVNATGMKDYLFTCLALAYEDPKETFRATANVLHDRTQAGQILKNFDAAWRPWLMADLLTYAQAVQLDKRRLLLGRYGTMGSASLYVLDATSALQWAWEVDAKVNLCRAALRLSLGEPFAGEDHPTSTTATAGLALDSPWRDPFTGAPLKMDAMTSSTLLHIDGDYYDSNTGLTGPIALRLPFRVKQ
jgi:hypothetical protein